MPDDAVPSSGNGSSGAPDERQGPTDEPDLVPLPDDWNRALCIVAHPDDLEYGASSAVARWTSSGKEVVYVMASRGEAGIDSLPPGQAGALREQEQRRAGKVVGVEIVEFLGHRDGQIEYSLKLRQDIARTIRRHKPDILVSLNHHETWGGHFPNMADHRAVGQAALDAARDAGNRWVYPELLALEMEPWNEVRMVCFSGSPQPTHAVDVTGFLEKGIASLKEHSAYLGALSGDFDPESFLRSRAEADGKRLGCDLAVSFEVFDL